MSTPSLSSLSSSSSSLSERLRANLHEAGFDIFHGPFAPSLYNDVLESEGLIASGTLSKLPEECTPTTAANDGGDGGGDGDDDDDSDNDSDDDDDDDDDPSNKNNNKNKEPLKTEAFLIGNTKHLWPIFLEWLERKERDNNNNNNNNNGLTIATKDPLDSYERTVIRAVVRDSLGANNNNNNSNARQRQRQRQRQSVYNVDVDTDVYCSSEWEDPTRMVSMARVASCTGYSYLDPHTHLSVHPVYGTWHSYRAVLLLPAAVAALAEEENDDSTAAAELKLAAPPPPPPRLLPNPVTPAETLAARRAFDRALAVSTTQTTNTNEKKNNNNNNHNENDDDNRLLCEELGSGVYKDGDEGRKQTVAAAWIALRDSVSIGRENHRFGDHQLSYHYTKDPSCLLAGIEALRSGPGGRGEKKTDPRRQTQTQTQKPKQQKNQPPREAVESPTHRGETLESIASRQRIEEHRSGW